MNCYHFENFYYKKGLFEIVEKTYVIHLEGNGRIDFVKKELDNFKPSKKCTIVRNKGYKKCDKPELPKQLPTYDLVHAYMTIFKDAKKKKYKHILILEDDFFFDENVKANAHHVSEFLKNNTDKPINYFLGCIPFLVFPSLTKHYKSIYRIASHSVIYNEMAIDNISNVDKTDVTDWDFLLQFTNLSYMYHKPLCYQYLSNTENSKYWGEFNVVARILCIIAKNMFDILGMDKSVTPGYPFFYLFSKIIFWIILFLILFLIFILQNKYKENRHSRI